MPEHPDTEISNEVDRRPIHLLDIDELRKAILEVDAKMVTIDPLMAFMPSNIDSHKDQDVRRVLARLKELAEETGAAIVLVRHLNKTQGTPAVHRGGGSIGIIGAARVGLLVAKDPKDERQRVLAVTKNNLARELPSLAFELADTDNEVARVNWLGPVDYSADDLVAPPSDAATDSAIDDALAFLKDILAEGPVAANHVILQAQKAGVAERTLKRAKKMSGVKAVKQGFGSDSHWAWTLPSDDATDNISLLKFAS